MTAGTPMFNIKEIMKTANEAMAKLPENIHLNLK
jgi:hypothetical protein